MNRVIENELTSRLFIQCLSPYMREHILRFEKWMLDMDDEPPALQPEWLIAAA